MPTRIGTAERGGTFHSQGLALKAALERGSALGPILVLESPGASLENAERLDDGAIDFGFMAANWVTRAARGEPPFAHAMALRAVAPMNVGPLFFIARRAAPIATVADLAGRRVVFGPEKSGMAQHARGILEALGCGDVRPVHLDFAAGADALAAGEADAQLQCPVPNQVMTGLCRRIEVRVLPYGPGALARVLAAIPAYRRTVMPAASIPGLERDVAQPGVLNLLVASARMADAGVDAMAGAIAANAAMLARLSPLFSGLGALLETWRATT